MGIHDRGLIEVGFWHIPEELDASDNLLLLVAKMFLPNARPNPKDCIDLTWDKAEKWKVLQYVN